MKTVKYRVRNGGLKSDPSTLKNIFLLDLVRNTQIELRAFHSCKEKIFPKSLQLCKDSAKIFCKVFAKILKDQNCPELFLKLDSTSGMVCRSIALTLTMSALPKPLFLDFIESSQLQNLQIWLVTVTQAESIYWMSIKFRAERRLYSLSALEFRTEFFYLASTKH